ncbi:hypothetical protein D3C72_1776940 [compost metagenome]
MGLEVAHVGEFAQAFPWCVKHNITPGGLAHREGTGERGGSPTRQVQPQLVNGHGFYIGGAGCMRWQINRLQPVQVIFVQTPFFFPLTGLLLPRSIGGLVKKIRL